MKGKSVFSTKEADLTLHIKQLYSTCSFIIVGPVSPIRVAHLQAIRLAQNHRYIQIELIEEVRMHKG